MAEFYFEDDGMRIVIVPKGTPLKQEIFEWPVHPSTPKVRLVGTLSQRMQFGWAFAQRYMRRRP